MHAGIQVYFVAGIQVYFVAGIQVHFVAGIQVYFVADIQVYFVAGIQVFQNDDKLCPERHGGDNITRLYIDSSKPVPLGNGRPTSRDSSNSKFHSI